MTSPSYNDEPLAEPGENKNVVTDQDDILPGTLEATAQFSSVFRVVYVNVLYVMLHNNPNMKNRFTAHTNLYCRVLHVYLLFIKK